MKDGHSFKVYLVTDILLFYDGDMFVGFLDRSTLWFQNTKTMTSKAISSSCLDLRLTTAKKVYLHKIHNLYLILHLSLKGKLFSQWWTVAR